VEPIVNPVTSEEHRARIVLPNGFEYKEAKMGNTVSFEVKVPQELAMRHQDTYAQLNAFDLCVQSSTHSRSDHRVARRRRFKSSS